ncbi:hypothetical protein Scep_003666 [Stephania cephalantha]|uniref:DNA (cytosine-5-)-methyltransferase n=1 Tax=Stephania cephalantha TaxID=152367 RepID=A0AAP0KQY3_9MAGN
MTSKKRRSSQSAKTTTQSKRTKTSPDDGSEDAPKILDLQNEEISSKISNGSKGSDPSSGDASASKKKESSSKTKRTRTTDPSSSNGASVNKDEGLDRDVSCRFVGATVPDEEARRRWPHRYEKKQQRRNDQEEALLARAHYLEAEVDGIVYNLNDYVHVQAEDNKPNYIARIVEFFESIDNDLYFTAQWFYRAGDTVIKDHANLIDVKRVFQSDIKDDNPLECLVSKLSIVRLQPNIGEVEKAALPSYDFFYDMKYGVPYSTIENLQPENTRTSLESSSTISSEASCDMGLNGVKKECQESSVVSKNEKDELSLLDLYSGCGAMSTGLCLGASLSGVNLITVRNEPADEFLTLLKEWERLCKEFSLLGTETSKKRFTSTTCLDDNETVEDDSKVPSGEFEVGSLVGICFGDPNKTRKKRLHFKNVVDILKFAGGFLGRYALSRLVAIGYQTRLGMMVAGCYGLPQFRMRAFFWGASTDMKLPQFPLPTHDVVVRGGIPNEFEHNAVAYEENHRPNLERALLLGDAISDLPPVTNDETHDEMSYSMPAETDFQKEIRLRKHEICTFAPFDPKEVESVMLHDHKPLQLNDDDYQRVCQIPKKKGACFRDLPGVAVGQDNKVEWDESIERMYLPSGKPLVPNYAMSFIGGYSSKPFSRLWWDETVPTVVTRAEPHNQKIMHPEQDRVLTVRENARLQGFPDYYKLLGPIKERYIQVGNAVAVPVARALGYALGMAWQGSIDDRPLLTLPPKFPCSLYPLGQALLNDINDA